MIELWKLIVAFVMAAGIPSTIVGIVISRFVQKQDKREKAKEEMSILIIHGVNASIGLGEAVAVAQKNGKCNGETEKAMEYAVDVKHKIRDFLTQRGVESVV